MERGSNNANNFGPFLHSFLSQHMVVNIRVCRVSVGCSKQELCKSESILLTDQFLWNKLVIHACQDNFFKEVKLLHTLGSEFL